MSVAKSAYLRPLLLSVCVAAVAGCANTDSGRAVTYQNVGSQGMVAGVGIESQDIVAMTDQMVRDLLANPLVMQRATAPRVIIDQEHFQNNSSQRIDKNLIVDRLRINLQRAANGRLVFLSRESAAMVQAEREKKRDGATDAGTTGLTRAQFGADYRMIGRISTLDARSAKTGAVERLTAITFELIDLETSASIWAGMYEFKKAGADDAVYR